MSDTAKKARPPRSRQRSGWGAGVALVVALMLIVFPRVHAHPRGPAAGIQKQVDLGARYYHEGRYDRAAEVLRSAYDQCHDPRLLFDIGMAQRKASRPQQALASFERYLQEDPRTPLRHKTEGYIRELQAEGARQVPAQPSPSSAPGQVAGKDVAQAVAAGPIESPAVPLAPTPGSAAQAGEPARRPIYERWWFWGALGLVAAGAAAGIAAGILTRGPDVPAHVPASVPISDVRFSVTVPPVLLH